MLYQPAYFAPTMFHTEVKDVPLKEKREFPLDIKVCFGPPVFTSTALKELGYRDELFFMLGLSKLKKTQTEHQRQVWHRMGWPQVNNQ